MVSSVYYDKTNVCREALEIVKASNDRSMMREVIEKNPRFKKIESEAVSGIDVFTGMKIPVKKKEDGYV